MSFNPLQAAENLDEVHYPIIRQPCGDCIMLLGVCAGLAYSSASSS
jgi:hypothetical protein